MALNDKPSYPREQRDAALGFDGAGKSFRSRGRIRRSFTGYFDTILTHGRVFGAHLGLHCLERAESPSDLATEGRQNRRHPSFFAIDRVLVISLSGELIPARWPQPTTAKSSRDYVSFADDVEIYSHPLIAGNRLYIPRRLPVSPA